MWQYIIASLVCLAIIPKDGNSGVILDPYKDGKRNIHDEIKFHLYTRKNPEKSYILLPGDDENFANSPFNPTRATIFFIHGFTGGESSESAQTVKKSYLDNADVNMILLCWRPLAAKPWYLKAIRQIPVVGKHTATMIKWLEYKQAVSIPEIHIVGFSLGAHVGASIGEELARNRSEKVGRITGLDPAGPAFDKLAIGSNGLDKDDATFVDVIHTNARMFGMRLPLGATDFYVNHGRAQEGCNFFNVGCSHRRAWKYYSESLSNPCGFPAERCVAWKPAISGCSRDIPAFMGVAATNHSVGIFSVTTKAHYPYATTSIQLPKMHYINADSNHTDLSLIDGEELKSIDLSELCAKELFKSPSPIDESDNNI